MPAIHQAFYESNCEVPNGLGVEEIHTFFKYIDHIHRSIGDISAIEVFKFNNNTTRKRKTVEQYEHN